VTAALHDGEPHVDPELVRVLVDEQLPQFSSLPLTAVASSGTDHHLYRLGDDLVVRLPRVDWATEQADQEALWLPRLAPHVSVALPHRVAVGAPGHGYPWGWSVYRWLPGRTPDRTSLDDQRAVAAPLGEFCAALRTVDTTGGPPAGERKQRGVPLALRDAGTRVAIAAVSDELDRRALTDAWDHAVSTPAWDGAPSWVHGDLLGGNLLVDTRRPDGSIDALRLTAVIDWGPIAVGDPATDAAAAWAFLSAETRNEFRATAAYDDDTWSRGRGWALSTALVALPYYRATSEVIATQARRTIREVLADPG
jgi:aminoglycoside phosphotransferase (APT) family kinase protein